VTRSYLEIQRDVARIAPAATQARDYLDVDEIRASGVRSDEQIMSAANERDPGFDAEIFVQQPRKVQRVPAGDVSYDGVQPEEWAAVQTRMVAWADSIEASRKP